MGKESWDNSDNVAKTLCVADFGLINEVKVIAHMEYNGQITVIKITVKEMRNPKDGNRIYSIKVLDVLLE